MPGKDGFSVFSRLVRDPKTRDVPVIMCTGVSDETGIPYSAAQMRQFFGKEPACYLEKPILPEKLQDAITQVLSA